MKYDRSSFGHRRRTYRRGRMGTAEAGGHAHHGGHSMTFWVDPNLMRDRPAEVRGFEESGPRQFTHSRFRNDSFLTQVLNGRRTMRRGARGASVRKVQQALIDLGFQLRFGADGDFGRETDRTVRAFQTNVRAHNSSFLVDGIVGENTIAALDAAINRLRLRKDVTALTATEQAALAGALQALNAADERRQFVVDHARRAIHGNAGFLPWHRQFILNFESRLRRHDDRVSLPYWNWFTDPGQRGGVRMWNRAMERILGGDGDRTRPGNRRIGFPVVSGPIGSGWSSFTATGSVDEPFLRRVFGEHRGRPSGGVTRARVMRERVYDVTPFDSSDRRGFRHVLEFGPHGAGHMWTGGQMADITLSPNDPAFFFHHCMVDKVWADWQAGKPAAAGYLPNTPVGSVPGRNTSMEVFETNRPSPGSVTPAATLDLTNQSDNLGNTGLLVRYV